MALRDTAKNSIQALLIKRMRAIAVIVALVILGLGYVMFIGPKYSSIQDSGILDVQEKKQRLTDRKAYLADLEDLVDRFDDVSQEIVTDLRRVLPREADIPGMFVQLEALARDAGYVPQQITMTQERVSTIQTGTAGSGETTTSDIPSTLGKLGVMNISMNVVGSNSYPDMKNLLRTYERNLRIFDVQSFTFNPLASDQAGEDSSISITFKTYFLIDDSVST